MDTLDPAVTIDVTIDNRLKAELPSIDTHRARIRVAQTQTLAKTPRVAIGTIEQTSRRSTWTRRRRAEQRLPESRRRQHHDRSHEQ